MRTKFQFLKAFQFNNAILILLSLGLSSLALPEFAHGQDDEKTEAVVRGKVEYDRTRAESWNGDKLVVPYPEIVTKLRQRLMLDPPPYPAEAKNWKPEQVVEWEKKFVESDAGKKFLEERKKLVDNANAFDVRFEKDGTFVVYDVPVGTYGIQGRVDKEINGTNYGFEVFGQIEILKDVDELVLPALRVEVTPLLTSKKPAPPVDVKTHDNKQSMSLKTFGDDYLFVNFWTSLSPTATAEQKLVQDMYAELKPKYNLRLLSINIDRERAKAIAFIKKKGFKGSHGFTDGVEHRTIFDYGARSFPSFWLIGKDDTILMSQYEIAQGMRVKPTLTQIVSDRIEGKDTPTLAEPTKADGDEKAEGSGEEKDDK